jgi:hypothetical protein
MMEWWQEGGAGKKESESERERGREGGAGGGCGGGDERDRMMKEEIESVPILF